MNDTIEYASDEDIEAFLEHHGVKGMHWGVRGTRRTQKIIDRTNRIATGKASTTDRLLGANRFVFTKKGAARQLRRGARHQAKIMAGKRKTALVISTIAGLRIKELDFHQGKTGATHAAGQKAAKAALATSGSVKMSSLQGKSKAPQSDAQINKQIGAFLKTHPTGR
jgi:hypothetical protein